MGSIVEDACLQHILEDLIGSFRLLITLRMIHYVEIEACPKSLMDTSPELQNESGSRFEHSIKAYSLIDVDLCQFITRPGGADQ